MVELFGCLAFLLALGILDGGKNIGQTIGMVIGFAVSVIAMLLICGYIG